MRGDVLVVVIAALYAGIQAAQHVGEITGLQGGERGGESQTVHLLIQCDQASTQAADN